MGHFALGLKELRDQKEVQFLSKVLLEIGHDRLGVACDLVVQRMREVMQAKKEGSSWEKAAVMSLMPGPHGGQALLPEGGFVV